MTTESELLFRKMGCQGYWKDEYASLAPEDLAEALPPSLGNLKLRLRALSKKQKEATDLLGKVGDQLRPTPVYVQSLVNVDDSTMELHDYVSGLNIIARGISLSEITEVEQNEELKSALACIDGARQALSNIIRMRTQ